jgi:hypothetical protein
MRDIQVDTQYFKWFKEDEFLANIEVRHYKQELSIWVRGTPELVTKFRNKMSELNRDGSYPNGEASHYYDIYAQFLITYEYRKPDYWFGFMKIMQELFGVDAVEFTGGPDTSSANFKKWLNDN